MTAELHSSVTSKESRFVLVLVLFISYSLYCFVILDVDHAKSPQ